MERALTLPLMGSRKVKFLLDSQNAPSRSGIENRPGLRIAFNLPVQILLLLELRPNDPLTIKDQGGEHQET